MASTFAGLSIATRGLYAAQAGLLVTNNNVSNAETEGYSRQTVKQSAVGAAAIYVGKGVLGGGVQVDSVNRVRNIRLDEKYWTENTDLGEWTAKSETLTEIEEIFTSDTDDFSDLMDEFYAALEDLSTDPSDSTARTTLRSVAEEVCSWLNNASEDLTQIQEDLNTEVSITVAQINSYIQQIADLNDQIRLAAASGASTNELEDQRTLLVDELSELVDIEVTQSTDDAADFTITTTGGTLVSDGTAKLLETYQNTDGLYSIRWQSTGNSFEPNGGSLKACLDLRDGTGSDSEYQGIPYYVEQLNEFARTFAEAFNEGIYADGTDHGSGHADGYGANGDTGIRFFSYNETSSSDMQSAIDALVTAGSTTEEATDEVYENITAANISLTSDILDEDTGLSNIAAASAADEEENNDVVNSIISMLQDNDLYNKGTPEDFMNSIIAALGTNSASAQRMADNQETIVSNVDDRRTSVSGVSTNEETANLTIYEQAYEASAQMVTVWNEVYDVTVGLLDD